MFIPCAGSKMLVHSEGGVVATVFPAGEAAARGGDFGEYARSPRYLVEVRPRETADTTMEIPSTAR
jgi:hypothetical protein